MRVFCGQCGCRYEAQEREANLVCPRCGHATLPPTADEESLASESEGLAGEGAEEEGFAQQARGTAARRVAVVCGSCGKSLRVSARLSGKSRRCPACKTKIRIPYPDDEEDVAILRSALAEKGAGLDLSGGAAASLARGPAASGEGEVPAALASQAAQASGAQDLAAPAAIPAQGPSAGTATLDLDDRGRRRAFGVAGAVILGIALAVGVGALGYRWFIRRPPAGTPAAAAPGAEPSPEASALPSVAPVATGPVAGDPATSSPLATAPVETPPPAQPRIQIAEATPDLFLADGYCPAAFGRVYWKVTATLTAGAGGAALRLSGPGAVLVWPEGNVPCQGVLEGGTWPATRLDRREQALAAGESAKATLLFDVPQGLGEATLRIAGFPAAPVRPWLSPTAPGGSLQAGTYVQSPPRNLRPLLADPVTSALQSAPKLEMIVTRQGEGFAVLLPAASVAGTAAPAGVGAYAVRLRKEAAFLDCRLRTAAGGRLLVLYLQDSPFHQLTFAFASAPPGP